MQITLHYKVNLSLFIIKLYGITQDPKTENYIMVLDYAKNGNLRNYLDKNYDKLSWGNKLNCLHNIAHGLLDIHEKGLIHRDLHIRNILIKLEDLTCITDMGLCKHADYNVSEKTKNSIYGVLPYVAPEILQGQNYTKASDIYSFGIIMYEVISGIPPYYKIIHDNNLAIRICIGLRPMFNNINVPQLIVHLIKRCLDADPLNRPKAEEIIKTLGQWLAELSELLYVSDFHNYTEMQKQINEAENINNSLPTSGTFLGISYETHSEEIHINKLLNYSNNLPEPKNSDDYYKVNDNIISMETSGS
jgi:serine/threonine protein kinase